MLNKLADIVRYIEEGLSSRTIGSSLEVSKTTVARYRALLDRYGLPPGKTARECSTRDLDAHLNRGARGSHKAPPDMDQVRKRLGKRGVTRWRLWTEYVEAEGERALGYVQFTRRLKKARIVDDVVFCQQYEPGYAALVDFSGDSPYYTDPRTGEHVTTQLFVGVLGHSSLAFARCYPGQTVPDWLDAHTSMVAFFGGVPKTIVCDNLKSGVIVPGKEGVLQRQYLDWGRHHGVAILPARAGQPRDKSKVEKAVRDLQGWLLPELDQRRHYSVDELNQRIAQLLPGFNDRRFQRCDESRRSLFEAVERATLRALPPTRFEYARWVGKNKVAADYHVPVLGHFYSVPYTLRGQTVEGRVGPDAVELWCDGERVARHPRSGVRGGHTTDPEHQHPNHRAQSQRTQTGVHTWALKIGPSMARVVEHQFAGKVPLQGLPRALVLWDLEKRWTPEQLELAAAKALARRVPNPTGVRRMLTETPAVPTKGLSVALTPRSRRRKAAAAPARRAKAPRSRRRRAS